ncbi:hypothetical protein GCM10027275_20770 [Rhabdobacter roseus]|uniref:DNA-binding LytR/AlgR family response regulator n=1 Tax=Rhabdobacter roseus TaxID=1655419 RepID=A0A840TVM7_9BACT|nr:LytTR family DNA-binding domain-containing protein [Rhabdobacter roseus]MBB5284010.1 DNA-binding LytR/AlgR family response regulator [Rhabdobacter roseus]
MNMLVRINRNHALHPAQVVLLEGRSNYTLIHFVGGRQVLSSYSLKVYEQALADAGFLRAHKSYLINPLCIRDLSRHVGGLRLLLSNGMQIEIARRRFGLVRNFLMRAAA